MPSSSRQNREPCPVCGERYVAGTGLNSHITRKHPDFRSAHPLHATTQRSAVISTLTTTPSSTVFPLPSSRPAAADTSDELEFVGKIRRFRRTGPLVSRIPKAARQTVADALVTTINYCIKNNNVDSWKNLFCFACTVFALPDTSKKNKVSLASVIKTNTTRNTFSDRTPRKPSQARISSEALQRKRVESELLQGNITGAVRILTSDDAVALPAPDVLEALHLKHPPPLVDPSFPPAPTPSDMQKTTPEEIRKAIRTFPNGSAAGFDGFKPQHLKDLLLCTSSTAERLCTALAELVDIMLAGKVPDAILPVLYGASLTALRKKDGGIRPIAVGNTMRRLACKIVSRRVADDMGTMLRPSQMGYGSPGGLEAVVHAVRAFCENEPDECSAAMKADLKNAFNAVRRDKLLYAVREHLPQFYPLIWQMYRSPSSLFYGDHTLASACGVQQGDPLGPLLFCLATRALAKVAAAPLNIWYLDDGTIDGPAHTVLSDLRTITTTAADLGLELNLSKCEVFIFGGAAQARAEASSQFAEAAPGIKFLSNHNFTLLGSPLLNDAIAVAVDDKIASLKLMASRLRVLPAHQALYLLKSSLGACKMLYLLRTARLWQYSDKLHEYDELLRSALADITNVRMTDTVWRQAALPVEFGGLGVRRTAALSLPGYLASVCAVQSLAAAIYPQFDPVETIAAPAGLWLAAADSSDLPVLESRHMQKCWDSPLVLKDFRTTLDSANDTEKARLLAVSTKESGRWVHALPLCTIGTLLDDDSLRISVAVRLGAEVCVRHRCRCGVEVDEMGRHGLRCTRSQGRHPRHNALNEIICRGLAAAGAPAILEPLGLAQNDDRRPDGVSQFPWKHGRQLIFDATCVDTFAHVSRSVIAAGTAANDAEQAKNDKYDDLTNRFLFIPVGFETVGSLGSAAKDFLAELGRKIALRSGEPRASEYLMQRVSLAIQRGNAVSILGTRETSRGLNEIFYILNVTDS